MNIEKQVCTLQQAIKLKELGISQVDSHFYYVAKTESEQPILTPADGYEWVDGPVYQDYKIRYAAFSSCELGIMLPNDITTRRIKNEGYCADYFDDLAFLIRHNHKPKPNDCEAHTRAEIVISLLAHGYVKASHINANMVLDAALSDMPITDPNEEYSLEEIQERMKDILPTGNTQILSQDNDAALVVLFDRLTMHADDLIEIGEITHGYEIGFGINGDHFIMAISQARLHRPNR